MKVIYLRDTGTYLCSKIDEALHYAGLADDWRVVAIVARKRLIARSLHDPKARRMFTYKFSQVSESLIITGREFIQDGQIVNQPIG